MTHDELLQYLDSDANEFGLDSTATHGFLSATVVGKTLPNWLSLLFEGQDSHVPKEVKTAILQWQQKMLADLKDETGISLPLDLSDSDDVDFSYDSELAAWSVGFVDAMYGDEAIDWFADEDTSEDVAMLTLPMMVFSGIDTVDEEEDEELAEIRADEDALAQMANSIEGNLTELFLLFNTDE